MCRHHFGLGHSPGQFSRHLLSFLLIPSDTAQRTYRQIGSLNRSHSNHSPKKRYSYRENLTFPESHPGARTEEKDSQKKSPTVPSTLKNVEGNSFPLCTVEVVNTSRRKVNPHQPMLNGNLLLVILANAKTSHNETKSPHARSY
jgi:hypothetical protein